eukprot:SAG11_NODE_1713_length_4398_cov_5.942080_2_plen_211_part_00
MEEKAGAGGASSSDGAPAGAAASSAATSDGLPGNLASASGALQSLLRKLGGGSFEELFSPSIGSTKLESLLAGLRSEGNDMAQLQALSELCEMLSMGTEESLGNFPCSTFVPALLNLLNAEWNPDLMLYSCRALTHLMEAMPSSKRAIVHLGIVDSLCAKLLTIEYIDLAEQALQALSKLSRDHGRTLCRSGGDLCNVPVPTPNRSESAS